MKEKMELISFDLWGTLIKSNPEYKIARTKLLSTYTDNKNIENEISIIKKEFDLIIEKYGIHIDSYIVYTAIFTKLNIDYKYWTKLIYELNDLFILHCPLIYDENTINTLEKIKQCNIKMILISNTVLINGSILKLCLEKLGIKKYFHTTFFSNEYKVSKPNPNIYSFAYNKQIKNILHVGDNETTDIDGSLFYGIKNALLINKNDKTILNVLDYL